MKFLNIYLHCVDYFKKIRMVLELSHLKSDFDKESIIIGDNPMLWDERNEKIVLYLLQVTVSFQII